MGREHTHLLCLDHPRFRGLAGLRISANGSAEKEDVGFGSGGEERGRGRGEEGVLDLY
jgi:hypothetical protein